MVGSLFSTFRRMYLLVYQSEKINNQNQKNRNQKKLKKKVSNFEKFKNGV